MIAGPTVWPLCPRPQTDESLLSWFERVAHEYDMSPALLMSVMRQDDKGQSFDSLPLVDRLYDSEVAYSGGR